MTIPAVKKVILRATASCPHCLAAVEDGATTCGVCKRRVISQTLESRLESIEKQLADLSRSRSLTA